MKKTVLITGASRGIGRAIAVAFAKAGYNLIITCSKSETELLHLKNDLERDYSVDVLASIGDISDFEYVTQLFSHIEQRFHGVDVLVNNAGISYASDKFIAVPVQYAPSVPHPPLYLLPRESPSDDRIWLSQCR